MKFGTDCRQPLFYNAMNIRYWSDTLINKIRKMRFVKIWKLLSWSRFAVSKVKKGQCYYNLRILLRGTSI